VPIERTLNRFQNIDDFVPLNQNRDDVSGPQRVVWLYIYIWLILFTSVFTDLHLQCSDTVGWATGSASGL